MTATGKNTAVRREAAGDVDSITGTISETHVDCVEHVPDSAAAVGCNDTFAVTLPITGTKHDIHAGTSMTKK